MPFKQVPSWTEASSIQAEKRGWEGNEDFGKS